MPFRTVRDRTALAMLALITVITPSAASRSVMPSSRASSPITRRAATSSSDMLPPKKLPRSRRPSTILASVTVARLPPSPYAAGPGTAPAERGPTLKAPAWSTKAIEPPPAPIVCTSIIGTSTGQPAIQAARASARDPGVARGRLAEAAVGHDADIGRGAADVEGDKVALARQTAGPVAAD